MKIAFIVGVFPSLSETFILNQITGLLELGHDVEVFSLHRSNDSKRHAIIDELKLMEKVHYFPDIPTNAFHRILKGKFLFLLNFCRDPKRLIKSINLFKFDKDFFSLKILYYVIPFLRKDFDVIHSHFGHIGNIGVYLRKGGVRGKLITSFYGYDLSAFINKKDRDVYKELFINGDMFLPICDYFSSKLLSLSCDPKKIKLHPIGIDLNKHRFIKRARKKDKCVKILSAGRLISKKGFIYSIKALKSLQIKKRDFIYTIIGDGPLNSELRKLVDDSGLKKMVRFAGSVNRGELLEYYEESDIFILPSITSEKGEKRVLRLY